MPHIALLEPNHTFASILTSRLEERAWRTSRVHDGEDLWCVHTEDPIDAVVLDIEGEGEALASALFRRSVPFIVWTCVTHPIIVHRIRGYQPSAFFLKGHSSLMHIVDALHRLISV